ncbi:hypothetical protein GCM10023085_44430 [Actinomadura viridis]|uniref:DNA polymerase III epsilon subunit-like protein n=1 Tax=Actinomadura viridis TaxID=58110 RepID=A0A931DMH1_9ACTN|nr:hypothetical protein [Actinomadura viridis]MBG6089805.1 DNA polymerase III epsilon subunit-like protein [Actinomadura viridis]
MPSASVHGPYLADVRLAFTDCETTGLRPDLGHGIWELAVIIRHPADGWDEEHVWQIRPDLKTADAKALEINDFHRRFLVPDGAEALWFPYDRREPVTQTAREAATQIQGLLEDRYLVGAVPAFDTAMITRLLLSHRLEPRWKHRLVCVENLVAGAVGQPVPQGLWKAAVAVGVPVDPAVRHTALGDARLARDVYDAVLGHETHGQRDRLTVSRADLATLLNRGTGSLPDEVAALDRLLTALKIED